MWYVLKNTSQIPTNEIIWKLNPLVKNIGKPSKLSPNQSGIDLLQCVQ